MRIAVITCNAYRDAWDPFFALFQKFFQPEYHVALYSDILSESWCQVAMRAAQASDEPLLMLLEDFFLTAPVDCALIERGIQVLSESGAGCVRLYPMPGGIEDCGDPHYALIPKGTPYRISTQAAIWQPNYLYAIARQCGDGGTAADFEIGGTRFAEAMPDTVLAFKYDVQPWPLEYLCSGISRGLWNPDSIKLFQQHGIKADLTRRPVAAS